MPTITVTNADHRNHAMARDISTGYTLTRTPGSSAFIESAAPTLKKYSSPIQMIPKIKCSHRNAINSFATPPGKLKCGFHSGNVASSHRHMRKPPPTDNWRESSNRAVRLHSETKLGQT